MDKISDVRIEPLKDSKYVRPLRMRFKQDNKEKDWDIIGAHDSVYIVIFNKSSSKLVLVRQFRPAPYYAQLVKKNPNILSSSKIKGDFKPETLENAALISGSYGVCLEMCAGLVDKQKLSLVEIAKEEVLEECGFEAPLESFELVYKSYSGIGASGTVMSLFYVEVTEEMRVSGGGGLVEEGEMIQVVEKSIDEIKKYIQYDSNEPDKVIQSPPAFFAAVQWFLLNKAPALSSS